MADKQPLDDLILPTEPESEKGKPKGLLALLALIILLIIVGAILAKMIFSSSDAVKTEKNKSNDAVVQTITDTNNNSSSDNTTAGIDIQDPDLAPLDDLNDSMNNTTVVANEVEGGVVEDGAPKNSNAQKENKSNSESKKEQLKTDTNEVVVEEIKNKNITHKPAVAKQHPKPKVTHTKKFYGGHGNVYIQVGSFVKGPESSFIEKIRRAGFRFRIKESNGKRRVYVGPFRSRQEAKNLLGIVRSKINPEAFIK